MTSVDRSSRWICPRRSPARPGVADAVVDSRNSVILAELIAGARLETSPGCGHLLFWEEPERFAALVSSFPCEAARTTVRDATRT